MAPNVIVGSGFTITVKLFAKDVHPDPTAFLTVNVPVYVPAAVFAGIGILIEPAGNVAFVTGAKVFAGLVFHVMLYVVGAFVTAL
ncbi:hypothetical protein D3C87_2055940 [compost metagenome]